MTRSYHFTSLEDIHPRSETSFLHKFEGEDFPTLSDHPQRQSPRDPTGELGHSQSCGDVRTGPGFWGLVWLYRVAFIEWDFFSPPQNGLTWSVFEVYTSESQPWFHDMGVSLNGGTPPKHPNMIILVGKPMVVGYHHFRKPPYGVGIYQFDIC